MRVTAGRAGVVEAAAMTEELSRPARATGDGDGRDPTPDGAAGRVPDELRAHDGSRAASFARRVAVGAALAAGVAALYFLAWQVQFFLALAFASLLTGVFIRTGGWAVGKLIGVRPGWGIPVFLIALVSVSATAALLFAPTVADQAQNLSDQLPAARDRARALVERYPWAQRAIDGAFGGGSEQVSSFARRAGNYLFSTVGALGTAVVVGFTGLYLAADPGLYTRGALHLVPHAHRDRAGRTMERVGYALRWWIIGQLASMTIVGVLTYVGLLVLGVPLALLCALLTMLLTFVPNLGPVVSLVPPTLLALTVQDGRFGGGPALAGYVVLLYLAVQTLESYLITPMIQKKAVELPPALLILFQIFVGSLLGLIGLALAAPLLAALLVAVSELYIKPVLRDPTPNVADRRNGGGD